MAKGDTKMYANAEFRCGCDAVVYLTVEVDPVVGYVSLGDLYCLSPVHYTGQRKVNLHPMTFMGVRIVEDVEE